MTTKGSALYSTSSFSFTIVVFTINISLSSHLSFTPSYFNVQVVCAFSCLSISKSIRRINCMYTPLYIIRCVLCVSADVRGPNNLRLFYYTARGRDTLSALKVTISLSHRSGIKVLQSATRCMPTRLCTPSNDTDCCERGRS